TTLFRSDAAPENGGSRSIRTSPHSIRSPTVQSCSVPRIVGAEVPDVAPRIAAGIAATAVVLVLERHDHRGAGFDGAGMVGVHVVHDDVGAGRDGAAYAGRWLLKPAELVVARRAQHDHAVAEDELGVSDRAAVTRHDEMLLEAEGVAEPFDHRCRISVAEGGNHRSDRLLGIVGHG